jgi:hypothetical protein
MPHFFPLALHVPLLCTSGSPEEYRIEALQLKKSDPSNIRLIGPVAKTFLALFTWNLANDKRANSTGTFMYVPVLSVFGSALSESF